MLACGKYNLVHEFFKKVQRSYIPNALIYKGNLLKYLFFPTTLLSNNPLLTYFWSLVLVNTLWREGKVDEAMMAVNEMERRGIVGSASLYYDLARCLCSVGRCHEALKQVRLFNLFMQFFFFFNFFSLSFLTKVSFGFYCFFSFSTSCGIVRLMCEVIRIQVFCFLSFSF